jgi:hypothetical protein
MKRILISAMAAVILAGCGGPKASDPKSAGGKDDPRIQRAGSGGGASSQQQGVIKAPSGKAAE